MHYQFTEDLITGNSVIDSEHKNLIKVANDVIQDISNGKGKDSVHKTFLLLTNYTETHFKHEEELQEKYQYPDMEAHKKWHKQFASDLKKTADMVLGNEVTSLMVIELTRKLNILLDHIRTDDKKLASFINKK